MKPERAQNTRTHKTWLIYALLSLYVFMLNVPQHDAHHALTPANVARRLNRAGNLFAIGMRAFSFAVPLVFWLFGPPFLVIATIGLLIALYHLDRSEPAPPATET